MDDTAKIELLRILEEYPLSRVLLREYVERMDIGRDLNKTDRSLAKALWNPANIANVETHFERVLAILGLEVLELKLLANREYTGGLIGDN